MFHFRSGKMSQAGADVCSGCPPGKYSGSRAAECITCSPGRYTRNAESAVCSLCPVGQFSREHGKSECVACPAGKSTNPGTAGSAEDVCAVCEAGWYGIAGEPCTQCAAGQVDHDSQLRARHHVGDVIPCIIHISAPCTI